jgi:hypothetical protein
LAVLALPEWRVFRFLLFLFTPGEPDVLDGGVVEGVGGGDLATGSTSASGWLVVSGSRDGALLAAWLE